jgi:hypothetical protein
MIINHCGNLYKNYLQLIFIIITVICLCIALNSKNVLMVSKIQKQTIQTHANAFIISTNCNSIRFNFTKTNIERVFPNFFKIYCFTPILLNDSRIDKSLPLLNKKLASNLISFVTLWTYEFTKYSTNDELEWSFIFEDDVNFIEPSKVSLPNYINALQELMHHPEIQHKHGMFYLGICGPTFTNDNDTIIARFSNNSLLNRKGYGSCAHAMGLTIKRARDLWTEISLYCPISNGPTDIYLRNYCVKSGNHYYTLGANLQWPPKTGHYGIAYQDRGRFGSEIW